MKYYSKKGLDSEIRKIVGSEGTDLQAVWDSLMGNSDDFANDKINVYHLALGSGLSVDVSTNPYTVRVTADTFHPYQGNTTTKMVASYFSLGGTYSSNESKLVWDNDHSAWHLIGNFYADGWISAGGISSGGGQQGGNASLSDITSLTVGKKGKISVTGSSTDYLWLYDKDYIDNAIQSAGTIQSVALASGSSNGTLHLVVNGTAASDVSVTGLADAAYRSIASSIGASVTGVVPGSLLYGVLGDAFDTTNTVKAFVNSSIATATATYRGSYNLVSDLGLSVSTATHTTTGAALDSTISTADNNDYCYVQIPTSDSTPTQIAQVDRYKHNGTSWSYEYTLNNSGYTSAQWAAINSGVTSSTVTAVSTLSGYFDSNGKVKQANLPSMYIGTTQVQFSSAAQNLTGIGSITAAGALTLTTTKKIYFGSTSYYIELDSNGYLHTNVGFYSDSFISAGGISSGGGSAGIDLQAMWNSLQNNDNADTSTTAKIHNYHLPACGTGLSYTLDANGMATNLNLNLSSSLVTTALGYTPVNPSSLGTMAYASTGDYVAKSGDTMTSFLCFQNGTTADPFNARIGRPSYYALELLGAHSGLAAREPIYVGWRNTTPYAFYMTCVDGTDVKVGVNKTPSYTLDVNGSIYATSFITSDGSSSKFLKADGSLDSNTYLTTLTASNTYVAKSGDTMSGWLTHTNERGTKYKNERKAAGSGGWASEFISCIGNDDVEYFHIGVCGQNGDYAYTYLGSNGYSGADLRIYPSGVSWGSNTIWHAGNTYVASSAITIGSNTIGSSSAPIGYATYASYDGAGNQISTYYLPLSGGTMTGAITPASGQSSVAWSASSLTLNGAISGATDITMSGMLTITNALNTDNYFHLRISSNSTYGVEVLSPYRNGRTKMHFGWRNDGTDVFDIDTNACVGIGNPSPAYKLDVKNPGSNWTTYIHGTNAGAYIGHEDGYGMYIYSSQNSSSYYLMKLEGYAFGTGVSAMTVQSDGKVGIGTFSPGANLHVNGSTYHVENRPVAFRPNFSWASGIYHDTSGYESMNFVTSNSNTPFRFIGGVGDFSGWSSGGITNNLTPWLTISSGGLSVTANVVANGAVTAGSASSRELKTNVVTMSDSYAERIIMGARPITFTWNALATSLYDKYVGDDLGMIAQEAEELIPSAVSPIFEKYKRLDYTKFVAPLICFAQNHERRLTDHELRIRELERENKELKEEIKRLRS